MRLNEDKDAMAAAAEALGIEIDADEEGVDTIAGLIAKRLGKVALPGTSVTEQGWVLTAEQAAGRRNRVVTILASPVGAAAQARAEAAAAGDL